MDQGNSTIYITIGFVIMFLVIIYYLKTVIYKKEDFDYEPQELEDRGKELLDLPNEKLTDEEYKLRLQKVYPYGDKDESLKLELEGSDE